MIYLKDIKDTRITRTIIGRSSSVDVSVLSEVEYFDCFTDERLTVEDCDEGLIYFSDGQEYAKLSSLKKISCVAIDVDSLHDIITLDDLVCDPKGNIN